MPDRELTDSQDIGEWWREHGVQGIRYPSAVPGFTRVNVVVFRDAVAMSDIVLVNRKRIIEEFRRLSGKYPAS